MTDAVKNSIITFREKNLTNKLSQLSNEWPRSFTISFNDFSLSICNARSLVSYIKEILEKRYSFYFAFHSLD